MRKVCGTSPMTARFLPIGILLPDARDSDQSRERKRALPADGTTSSGHGTSCLAARKRSRDGCRSLTVAARIGAAGVSDGLRKGAKPAGQRTGTPFRSTYPFARENVLSDLDVQSDCWNPHRPSVSVVSGIGHMLEIERREEAWKQPRAVVRFGNILRAISKRAISDDEVQTALCQICRMYTRT